MHRQAMSTARCRVAGHSARPGERITVPAHCRLVLTASGCWLKETVSLLRRTCSCFKFCSLTFQTFLFVSAGPGAGWKRLQQLEETNWKCQDVWRSSGSGRERLQVSMGCKSWGRIWQKTTKFCKAIILQLKNKLKKKMRLWEMASRHLLEQMCSPALSCVLFFSCCQLSSICFGSRWRVPAMWWELRMSQGTCHPPRWGCGVRFGSCGCPSSPGEVGNTQART